MEIDYLEANTLVQNKRGGYNILTNLQGYYLPTYTSKAITEKFIVNSLSGKLYLLK